MKTQGSVTQSTTGLARGIQISIPQYAIFSLRFILPFN